MNTAPTHYPDGIYIALADGTPIRRLFASDIPRECPEVLEVAMPHLVHAASLIRRHRELTPEVEHVPMRKFGRTDRLYRGVPLYIECP